jgi:DNA-binding NarL/FixJ family response regulator
MQAGAFPDLGRREADSLTRADEVIPVLRRRTFLSTMVGGLIAAALPSHADPGFDRLSRRLRETLACLLEGESEKHVASRLGLSQATIHQYVTALYRRFNVGSRAQLLATIMRRTGRERRDQLPPLR